MSLNRFQFSCWFIGFNDGLIREERFDNYVCIKDFFEEVNTNFVSMWIPSVYLAIDETLYLYRGRIGIKQCDPSKPAKYRALDCILCNAKVRYTYYSLPYASKSDKQGNTASKYSVTGTDEYMTYLVTNTSQCVSLGGCNISSMDRYFTSLTSAIWGLRWFIMVAGTIGSKENSSKTEITRESRKTTYIVWPCQKRKVSCWFPT